MSSAEGANGHLVSSYSNPDEELDRAIALSLSEAGQDGTASMPRDEFEQGPIVSDRLKNGSFMVRRFVDSDNSCLFTAVAYVMEGNRLRGFDLRGVIAATVRSDVHKYNEGTLDTSDPGLCHYLFSVLGPSKC